MNITSQYVKEKANQLGTILCGIANIERFENAPKGFHPTDVLPNCKSVIVFATKFLKSTLNANSTIPYTDVRDYLSAKNDEISIKLAYLLENDGATAIPINSIGPNEWDERTNKKRGIISLKHSAELAGLGRIGKNTLLVNNEYGNMIWLGAVLVSKDLTPDPIAEYEGCISGCKICMEKCPVQALDGISMDQKKCWEYAFGEHNGGGWRIKCFKCRSICPRSMGIKINKSN